METRMDQLKQKLGGLLQNTKLPVIICVCCNQEDLIDTVDQNEPNSDEENSASSREEKPNDNSL